PRRLGDAARAGARGRLRRHRRRRHRCGWRARAVRTPAVVPGRPAMIARVTTDVLDLAEHAEAVTHPGAGAVVTFAGVVRDHDGGRAVVGLTYEAHPSAEAVLATVAAEIAKDPAAYA